MDFILFFDALFSGILGNLSCDEPTEPEYEGEKRRAGGVPVKLIGLPSPTACFFLWRTPLFEDLSLPEDRLRPDLSLGPRLYLEWAFCLSLSVMSPGCSSLESPLHPD